MASEKFRKPHIETNKPEKMKKTLLIAIALIFALTSCKKEIHQLAFSLGNLSTLLDKSTDYVMKASPGTVDEEKSDYIYFLLEDEMEDIDQILLYYDFINDKCDFLSIYSMYLDQLGDAITLLELAEDEAGEAEYYYLAFYDASSVWQELEFDSLNELLTFITNNNLTVAKVDEIIAIHHFNDAYFMSGGYFDDGDGKFISLVEIGWWDDLSKADTDIEIVRSRFRNDGPSHLLVK
jgi:hypothetical protein